MNKQEILRIIEQMKINMGIKKIKMLEYNLVFGDNVKEQQFKVNYSLN
jgi:hypothetical protein